MDHVSRREFATAVAALALTPVRVFAAAPDSGRELPRWREYADLTAIDFLASPGPFNTPNDLAAPLNAQMLENASRSGITAVNLTVDGDTVEQTFSSIAYWEREVDAHPDVLTHVRTLQDLRAAKQVGRLGLIYGFQGTRMFGRRPRSPVALFQLRRQDRAADLQPARAHWRRLPGARQCGAQPARLRSS